MDRTELAAIATATAGKLIKVTFTDGTDFTVVSEGKLNSKGFVYRMHADEPSSTFAVTKIQSVDLVDLTIALDDELTADDIADGIAEIEADDAWMDEDTEADYIADMIKSGEVDLTDVGDLDTSDTFTTRQAAELFGLEAKVLRVHLRAWGMGVGQGRTYGLTSEDIATIRTKLAEMAEQA